MNPSSTPGRDVADRYLDLLKQVLTRTAFTPENAQRVIRVQPRGWKSALVRPLQSLLASGHYQIFRVDNALQLRTAGRDWPESAETMIGLPRLDNLQHCIESVVTDDVPGDLIEAGVWRGGASIFMRAVLAARDVRGRKVWAADSFQGLPPPNPGKFPADRDLDLHRFPELSVGLEEVRENFRRYGLLDAQVEFLAGWFRDTLATAPIEQLAVMRIDCDLYESTFEALSALYPRLSQGGYAIVDDYGELEPCRRAVDDFRSLHNVREPIRHIDHSGVFWRRNL
jgi:O-methyltransferase